MRLNIVLVSGKVTRYTVEGIKSFKATAFIWT